MRNLFQSIIIGLLLILGRHSIYAQTFSSMNEKLRKEKLTQIALKVYKNKQFSKYYSK